MSRFALFYFSAVCFCSTFSRERRKTHGAWENQ